MSEKAKKTGIFCHFEEVEGGLICQVKQNGDACGTKLGSKKFNMKRRIGRYHKDIFKSIVEEEQMQINSSNQVITTAVGLQVSSSLLQNFSKVKKSVCP